jgi:hypothetical protein
VVDYWRVGNPLVFFACSSSIYPFPRRPVAQRSLFLSFRKRRPRHPQHRETTPRLYTCGPFSRPSPRILVYRQCRSHPAPRRSLPPWNTHVPPVCPAFCLANFIIPSPHKTRTCSHTQLYIQSAPTGLALLSISERPPITHQKKMLSSTLAASYMSPQRCSRDQSFVPLCIPATALLRALTGSFWVFKGRGGVQSGGGERV